MKRSYPVLFAILTFWLSEAAFRPPATDKLGYDDRHWNGWGDVLAGYSEGSCGYSPCKCTMRFWPDSTFSSGRWKDRNYRNPGPVYALIRIPYSLLDIHLISPERKGKFSGMKFPPDDDHPTDIIAFLMWTVVCYSSVLIFGFFRRRKRKKLEAKGLPVNSQSFSKLFIGFLVLMALGFAMEVRNATKFNDDPINIIAPLMWALMWIVICYGSVVIFRVLLKRRKKTTEAEGLSPLPLSHRKLFIGFVILMTMGIVAAEIRNWSRSQLRKSNQSLYDAVVAGDVVSVNKYLDQGGDVNVMISRKATLLDKATRERFAIKGDKESAEEIIALIKTNGGKT